MTDHAPNPTGLPFDDFRALVKTMPTPSVGEASDCGAGELVNWIGAWQGRPRPALSMPTVCLFAASHESGLGDRVDDAMKAVQSLLEMTAAGGAPVNPVCLEVNAGLKAFDLAIDMPVPDILVEDAHDEAGAAATIAFGMEAIAGGSDLLGLSAIEVGGKLSALTVATALMGEDGMILSEQEGRFVDAVFARKGQVPTDSLEVMRTFAGREVIALVGAMMAARHEQVPVIIDGLPALVAALILHRLDRATIAHVRLASVAGPQEAAIAEAIGLTPVLNLAVTAGPGVASAMVIGLARAAVGMLR